MAAPQDFIIDPTGYSVSEFFELFSSRFPVIAIITQGYYGEILDDVFAKDEVFRIQTFSSQDRVVAKTVEDSQWHDRLLSLPLTYPIRVRLAEHGEKGEEKCLQQIINENTLPATVQFARTQYVNVANRTMSTKHIPKLQLTETFKDIYLLGNILYEGGFSEEIIPIPLYLSQLRLAEVTGLRDQPEENWKKFKDGLDLGVALSVQFDAEYGSKDIAIYNPASVPKALRKGQYMEPRMYVNFSELFQSTAVQETVTTMANKTGEPVDSLLYEEISQTPSTKQSKKKEKKKKGKNNKGYEELKKRFINKPTDPQPLDSVYDELMPLTSNASSVEENNTTTGEENCNKAKEHTAIGALNRCPPEVPKRYLKSDDKKPELDVEPHPVTSQLSTTGLQPPAIPERKGIVKVKTEDIPDDKSKTDHESTTISDRHYANDIPRGTVTPTQQRKTTNAGTPALDLVTELQQAINSRTSSQQDDTTNNSVPAEDSASSHVIKDGPPIPPRPVHKENTGPLPTDEPNAAPIVESLMIEELCQWLCKLNLSKYAEQFHQEMVDGAMLQVLDLDILQNDFGMKKIEAIRLMKFAKEGHVPR